MRKTLSFKEDVIRIRKRKISTGFSYGERWKPAFRQGILQFC
jgi:hypothetical protein